MNVLFSIIIATKNRQFYCQKVIESILTFDEKKFQLVVQDNSDTNRLKKFAESVSDSRFTYNYTPPPFSSIDNFNEALSISNGEYVCLIGDDDIINPDIFEVVRWAKRNNVGSIIPGMNSIYWWPDATEQIPDKEFTNGLLQISPISLKPAVHNSERALTKLVRRGGQDYLSLYLPKFYHGIVRREYFEMHRNDLGYYIGGLSPDIYTAVMLTKYIDKSVTINYPLTIPGICIASTSADSARGINTGKLEDAMHFRDRGPYDWSSKVPRFYSGINIWADSALASLKDIRRFDLIDQFSISELSVYLLKRHSEFSDIIIANLMSNSEGIIWSTKTFTVLVLRLRTVKKSLESLISRIFNRIYNYFTIPDSVSRLKSVDNVTDIDMANKKLKEHLIENGLSIDLLIRELDKIIDESSPKSMIPK